MMSECVSGEFIFFTSEWPICAAIAPAPVPYIDRVTVAATASATSAGTPTFISAHAFLAACIPLAL